MNGIGKSSYIRQNPRRHLPSTAFSNLCSYTSYKEDCPVFACRFNPDRRFTSIFAYSKENGEISCGDTRLAKWDKNRLETTPASSLIVKTFEADHNAIFDCQWRPSYYQHLLAASGDGSVSLWDIEGCAKLSTFRGHTLSIRRLSVCQNEPHLFATAGRDGTVMVWDTRMQAKSDDGVGPVRTICNAHALPCQSTPSPKAKRGKRTKSLVRSTNLEIVSVTAVLLHNKETVVSGSSKMSDIRFWDLRKVYSTKPFLPPTPSRVLAPPMGSKQGAGYTSFSTEPFTGHTLYASRTDSVVYAYSLTTCSSKPVMEYTGARISSFYVHTTACPTLPYLLCGSREGAAFIWSMDSAQPAYFLTGHTDEVCALACNDNFEILSFSDDTWRLWKIDGEAMASSQSGSCDLVKCQPYCADVPHEPRSRKRMASATNGNENYVPTRPRL